MSTERGVIRNETRAKQLCNFKGLLRQRNITPTDIDGLIDYGGKYFLYIEGKMKGKKLSDERGQKVALENVIKSHWKASNPSAIILFEHEVPADKQIDVAEQFVRMVFTVQKIPMLCSEKYQETHWWFVSKDIKVVQAVDIFEAFYCVFPSKVNETTRIYDKVEVEIIYLKNGQYDKRYFNDYTTIEQATQIFDLSIIDLKKQGISSLVCMRTYKGENATMIKNEMV